MFLHGHDPGCVMKCRKVHKRLFMMHERVVHAYVCEKPRITKVCVYKNVCVCYIKKSYFFIILLLFKKGSIYIET